MARKFIPFEQVEELATIEQLAQMLGLDTHRYGSTGQLRCPCPVHGGDKDTLAISPQVRSRRGSLGVFFCQAEKTGGDRIGLVAHCMQIGQQDAAFFIADQFGEGTGTVETGTVEQSTVSKVHATVPQGQLREPSRTAKPRRPFDPAAFAAKLAYTDEVRALGFSPDDAQALGIGFYRGQVYIPVRHPSGAIGGFIGWSEGKLKLPPRCEEAEKRGITFDEMKKIEWNEIPLGRAADPAEVVAAIAFLASTDGTYLTGTTIDVNGGVLFT